MKKDDILNKKFDSRKEEEKVIKEYINMYSDIDDEESEELIENLDVKTIKAFEEAMEKVATEYDREKTDSEILINYIRRKNNLEEIVSMAELKLNPPEGLNKEKIDVLFQNSGDFIELENLEIIETKKDLYLYDSTLWTGQYAATAVLLKEKDILEAIAQRTRRDCKIYPRPLQISALKDIPYNYSEDEILGAIARMKLDNRYSDIGTVTASNGGVCLYSSEYMSEKYAQALCEEIEVEWKKQQ
ncbi:MAG: hypothetical protein GXY89_07690 [Tissierellia bacterium]|mgnify:CR=1 FL=1|jgi:hypothetical protein|nr:hypothetical protein [Tissierellia bacterium]